MSVLKSRGAQPVRVTVFGLWHLGCVTAACLAEAGHQVTGLDPDPKLIAALRIGSPPLHEPDLPELLAEGLGSRRLRFTQDAHEALADAEVLWVCFDTPVDDEDRADVSYVRGQLENIADEVDSGTLVLISSQVPVGFGRALADDWRARGVTVACSPENLRLGTAINAFRHPERVVIGLDDDGFAPLVKRLLKPFTDQILVMSLASAEMAKHAVNAFLAVSVSFANELARICEITGADASEVASALKSEGRIGPRAYLSPGAAFAGGTLARDVRFLQAFGDAGHLATPLLDGLIESNAAHRDWPREHLRRLLAESPGASIAVLGLTYKPNTSTLRRSTAVAHCHWLIAAGASVRAFDPQADPSGGELPAELVLCESAQDALRNARAVLIATPWPQFRDIGGQELVSLMERPFVIDETRFLEPLACDPQITYVTPGRPGRSA